MPLILNEVKVWNDGSDGPYRLIIKDGDKIVKTTNAIGPNQPDGLANLRIPIKGPLTLIAVKD